VRVTLDSAAKKLETWGAELAWQIRTSDKAAPDDLDRIRKMQVLAAEEEGRWRTVQEWYMSMKRQELV
jgi:hypothetical protein